MIYTGKEKNVRIVPFERSRHLTEKYRSWFHDDETTKYNSHGLFPYTAQAMEEFIATIEKGSASKIVWAIEVKLSDAERKQGQGNFMPLPPNAYAQMAYGWKHVGNCSLQSINLHNRSAEFAVVIGEAEARGKGIGTAVLGFTLAHAFLRLGLNRVWTGTSAKNQSMQKVAVMNDMILEGVFKEGMWSNGKFVDVLAYGILAADYFKVKGMN